MAISDYSTTRDDNAAITPGNIRSNDFARDQQIINAIRQLMADLASHVGTTAEFNIVQFNASTGALQSGDSGINFDQIWHDDATNTWYIVSDGASHRETTNTIGTLNVGRLRLNYTGDISSLSSTGHAFQIGPDTGQHLAIDTNEIQSRNNGGTGVLLLNDLGGNIIMHGNAPGILDLQGGQIQFPAAQDASADANTLDDYEEGTWTPTITFTTPGDLNVVYSSQVGRYIKVGKVVTIWFRLTTSTLTWTTASSRLRLEGIPFVGVTASGLEQTGSVESQGITQWGTAGHSQLNLNIVSGANDIRFIGSVAGTNGRAEVQAADMTSGTNISLYGSITYEAAA